MMVGCLYQNAAGLVLAFYLENIQHVDRYLCVSLVRKKN